VGFHPILAWKKLWQDNRVNHDLTQWESEKGLLSAKIKVLENKLIDKRMMMIEKVLDAKASASTESEVLKILGALITNKTPPADSPQQPNHPQTSELVLTEEQIRGMLSANPKIKRVGKALDDETLRTQIINYVPNISKESLEKTIVVIRE